MNIKYIDNAQEKMNKVGFKLPHTFRKKDPRGYEHGFFTASWTEEGMEVTKYSATSSIHEFDVRDYSMHFGCFEDFESWAKDCT